MKDELISILVDDYEVEESEAEAWVAEVNVDEALELGIDIQELAEGVFDANN